MEQKDKELLLKDICARLPYNVKVRETTIWYENGEEVEKHEDLELSFNDKRYIIVEFIKPYLFPLSSITEEQLDYIRYNIFPYNTVDFFKYDGRVGGWFDLWLEELPHEKVVEFIDYLNENHFDYRNLINKGLAIDCTNLNIY